MATVRRMSPLSTQLPSQVRALGEGTVRVAVSVVCGVVGGVRAAVRCVAAFGSDVVECVFGEVGEVCGVSGGHSRYDGLGVESSRREVELE